MLQGLLFHSDQGGRSMVAVGATAMKTHRWGVSFEA
jgi:hypothetical protein